MDHFPPHGVAAAAAAARTKGWENVTSLTGAENLFSVKWDLVVEKMA